MTQDELIDAITKSIVEPESKVFNREIYSWLGKISQVLLQQIHRLDAWRAQMAANCPHVRQSSRDENNYTTTRCDDCGYVLRSQPLPGVEWDRD